MIPLSDEALPWAQNISFAGIFVLFFLHGLRLPRQEVARAMLGWRLQGTMLAFTFLLMPLFGIGLSRIAAQFLPASLAAGLLYAAILPSTVQSAVSYTSLARGNIAASVIGSALSNLSGIFLTPLLFALLLGSASGAAVGGNVVVKIITMLLLPFVIGQAMQKWFGKWAADQRYLLTFFDRGVILLAVYVAFGAAVTSGALAGIDGLSLVYLLFFAGIFLGIAFGAAWMIGGALGFSHDDRISLLFAGAHKSIAIGAPMAALLFPPTLAGLMIVPTILYHQLQLIASAPLAKRLARD
ncbi:bile acid:sodium symporter [Sphingorhabdus contaminans]|uniref:Bile acid:sodium symporter n=2 Tax=Sphingorhabdus contaminans TaxID=1343899 RepID=A0A553WLA2_9SPHN|nr:bile acid:sodium symporter [Sphingorhabdus contaminans]